MPWLGPSGRSMAIPEACSITGGFETFEATGFASGEHRQLVTFQIDAALFDAAEVNSTGAA